jgi:hypothetical protein
LPGVAWFAAAPVADNQNKTSKTIQWLVTVLLTRTSCATTAQNRYNLSVMNRKMTTKMPMMVVRSRMKKKRRWRTKKVGNLQRTWVVVWKTRLASEHL